MSGSGGSLKAESRSLEGSQLIKVQWAALLSEGQVSSGDLASLVSV